jgi:putative SOS response-associated peptidase YedK
MCNLYSMTSNREAIRQLARAMGDLLGNLPPLPGIFPDFVAPIVRDKDGERVATFARWGLPSLKWTDDGKPHKGTTNVRHPWFDDWKGYLGVENRCLVPFTSFSEPTKLSDGKSGNAWFALNDEQPLLFFAGLWTPWRGMRRKDEGMKDHDVFAFLTTKPNDVVGPIHEKAMPVILTTEDEREAWLSAPWSEARALQRSLPDGTLTVISTTPLGYSWAGEPFPSGDPLRPNEGEMKLL